jgi:hypothetical protein
MKTTTILILTFAASFTSFADEPVTHEFLAAVYRGNHTYVIDQTTASSAGGAIVRCGDTYLTPRGAYVQIRDTFLKPGGGAVVDCKGSYVGTANATARVGTGANNLAFVGSDGASFGAGETVLRPLLIAH